MVILLILERMRMSKRIQSFLFQHKPINIYGGGTYAFWLIFFCHLKSIPIKKVIISKRREKNEQAWGYQVEEFRQIRDEILHEPMIVAVSASHHNTIKTMLNGFFENVYFMQREDIEFIWEASLKEMPHIVLRHLENLFCGTKSELFYDVRKTSCKIFLENLHKALSNSSSAWLEYIALRKQYKDYPRYTECEIDALHRRFLVPDMASFFSSYREIIVKQIYKFIPRDMTDITIVDIGANIGLSVLYFAENYPKARIDAFEADPKIFAVLEHNVRQKKYPSIHLYNKAVWDETTCINFYEEGADGGYILEGNRVMENRVIPVQSIDAATLMGEYKKIDFLKMDIEGAETRVLQRIQSHLFKVDHIFIEYHSIEEKPQTIHVIFDILAREGFRVYMTTNLVSDTPYVKTNTYNGFDLLVNIYGKK